MLWSKEGDVLVEQIWQALLTILGGLIAGGVGLFVNWKDDIRKNKNLRKQFITGICDDLDISLHLFDKVSDEFEKTKEIWLLTLKEFRESRQTYRNNNGLIITFDDEKLRKDIFKYYNRTEEIINRLEYQQQRKMAIEDKINIASFTFMSQNTDLNQEKAIEIAKEYHRAEYNEYLSVINNIPGTIQKLKEFKSDARDLMRRLKDN